VGCNDILYHRGYPDLEGGEMKKVCWALQYQRGFVQDLSYPIQPLKTLLFRTRNHALAWLEDNPYWVKLKATPVRVKVMIDEV
jgi:hypothetical protein